MALTVEQQRTLYWEGYAARLDAMGLADCPYDEGTEEYTEWLVGFNAAWADVRESSFD